MGAFLYRLEQEVGTPADPPTLASAVPDWRPAMRFRWGAPRRLRVVEIRDDDADQPPTLVVEDLVRAGHQLDHRVLLPFRRVLSLRPRLRPVEEEPCTDLC
jgi:hypothetical protein